MPRRYGLDDVAGHDVHDVGAFVHVRHVASQPWHTPPTLNLAAGQESRQALLSNTFGVRQDVQVVSEAEQFPHGAVQFLHTWPMIVVPAGHVCTQVSP